MANRLATFFPDRLSMFVPSMKYSCDVEHNAPFRAQLGAPVALDADGILNDQSIATAGETAVFQSTYSESNMSTYGRNVTCVASGAATSNVTVHGFDYLGQPMTESMTLNGTTTVQGLKAFRRIEKVVFGATAATTIDVGWGNKLGLPYKFKALILELKNGVVAANAGTFVAGLATGTAATATNADTRGTYLPSTVLPDGANTFEVLYLADNDNLHGNAQFKS